MNKYLFNIVIIFILTGNVVAQSNQTTMTRLKKVEDLYLSDKYAQALELVNKLITEEPNNYQAYLQRAQVYFYLKQSEKREADFKKALELAPGQPYVYKKYGGFLKGNARTDEALKLYKQGITLIPKSAELHYQVGVIYDDSLKNQQEALRYYEKAVDLNPTKPHYYYMIGAVLRDLGNLTKAYVAFSQALAQHARKKNDNINKGRE